MGGICGDEDCGGMGVDDDGTALFLVLVVVVDDRPLPPVVVVVAVTATDRGWADLLFRNMLGMCVRRCVCCWKVLVSISLSSATTGVVLSLESYVSYIYIYIDR